MEDYSKLLLEAGGGIYPMQRAEYDHQTGHVLIGLGGTGIDCLKKIKNMVWQSVKPDWEDNHYGTLRFLAIDSDQDVMRDKAMDGISFLNLMGADSLERQYQRGQITERPEYDWMDPGDIRDPLTGNGAGAQRKVGRHLFMDCMDSFCRKMEESLFDLISVNGTKRIYIHLFTGLCGGTGSGIFLDVCYLLRERITAWLRFSSAKIVGYFFLPEVNLSNMSFLPPNVKNCLIKNGYAALQELDYCMHLEQNGGAFAQKYAGGKQVLWEQAPVDVCHLIGAGDHDGETPWYGYDHALQATALYVMEFLRGGQIQEDQVMWMLQQTGRNPYCSIGAAQLKASACELNTLLASMIFEKISETQNNIPEEKAYRELAERAKIDSLETLYSEIEKGAESKSVVVPEKMDWRYVREHGETVLDEWQKRQLEEHAFAVEQKAKSILDWPENPNAPGRRICREIDACVRDIHRGPVYAYELLKRENPKSVQKQIESFILEAKDKLIWLDEEEKRTRDVYQEARAYWMMEKSRSSPLFGRPQKAYQKYQAALEDYVSVLMRYQSMDRLMGVLYTLQRQIEKKTQIFYRGLCEMMKELQEVFAQNQEFLKREEKTYDAKVSSMISRKELENRLEQWMEDVPMEQLFSDFMQLWLEEAEVSYDWVAEEKYKNVQKVRGFFDRLSVEQVTAHTARNLFFEEQQNAQNLVTVLEKHSEILFSMGTGGEEEAKRIAYLSRPVNPWMNQIPLPVHQLSAETAEAFWGVYTTGCMDAVSMIQCQAGIPLRSWANRKVYEQVYLEDMANTAQFHIGKCHSKDLSDWSELPLL